MFPKRAYGHDYAADWTSKTGGFVHTANCLVPVALVMFEQFARPVVDTSQRLVERARSNCFSCKFRANQGVRESRDG